jgi:hypothetical protein
VLALDAQEGEHLVHVGSIPRRDRVYRMSWSPHTRALMTCTRCCMLRRFMVM